MTPVDEMEMAMPTLENVGPRFVNDAFLTQPDTPVESKKKRPTPGSYVLQFGTTMPMQFREEKRGVRDDGTEWAVEAKVEVEPKLTVVAAKNGDLTFAGVALDPYYKLTTLPVKYRGVPRNFSTLSAAMALVGLEYPIGADADGVMAVAAQMSGLITQQPVTVTWQGEVKDNRSKRFHVCANGTRLYFDEKIFRTSADKTGSIEEYAARGGEWSPVAFIVNDAIVLERPSENVVHEVIFAKAVPHEFGWKPRT